MSSEQWMKERISMVFAWPAGASNHEEIASQNMADGRFDQMCNLVKMLGIAVAPTERFLRMSRDEDGCPMLFHYSLSASIEGTKEAIAYCKEMLDRKLPPPYEARHVEYTSYREMQWSEEHGTFVLMTCCFCSAAFRVKAIHYKDTPTFQVEYNVFCPHCHEKIISGQQLAVIPTTIV